MSAANRYRLVVGELGPGDASAFHAMTSRAHDGETAVTGPISDQSHLHGLIEPLDGLGLTLHSLTPRETAFSPHAKPTTPTLTRSLGHNQPGPITAPALIRR